MPGILGRRGDAPELAEARHRAASRIRALRVAIAGVRHYAVQAGPTYRLSPAACERVIAATNEIRSLREIFKRPASRPGRPDLAGLGAASRDGGAQPEAPERALVASSGPAAVFHVRGGRDLSPPS